MIISRFNSFNINEMEDKHEHKSSISVNGIVLNVIIKTWSEQTETNPKIGMSAYLDMSNKTDWENLIKASIWSEDFFINYQKDDKLNLKFFSVNKTIRGVNNNIDFYDYDDIADMFKSKMNDIFNKELKPDLLVQMIKKEDVYTDVSVIDDFNKERKLNAFSDYINAEELSDTIRSISKSDLVKMARGAKELSTVAEKAIKQFMKIHKKNRAVAIEDILNLMTDNK